MEQVNDFIGIFLPLMVGLYAYKYMNLLYRIYFYQLVLYSIIYILAYIVLLWPLVPNNNQWLFNLWMPIESCFLCWGGYEYFKGKKKRILIWVGFLVFMVVVITHLALKGMIVFFYNGYVVESALLISIYLSVLYALFITENSSWRSSPQIWISIGIVSFFGGGVPYFSLMGYLQSSHAHYSMLLYRFIIEGLSTVRYLMLGWAFWLVRRNHYAKGKP